MRRKIALLELTSLLFKIAPFKSKSKSCEKLLYIYIFTVK